MSRLIIIAMAMLLVNADGIAIQTTPPTFKDMIVAADLIAAGSVTDIRYYEADDQSTIYTFVTLSELDIIDGKYSGSNLTLRFEGGEVGTLPWTRRGMKISGMPEFSVGDRVLMFITGNTLEVCPLVGWELGLFMLVGDSQDNQRVLAYRSRRELAAVSPMNGQLQLQFKVDLSQNEGITITDSNPVSNQARIEWEAAERQRIKELNDSNYTFIDFRDEIQNMAEALRQAGVKTDKEFINAIPELHRPARKPIPTEKPVF